MIYLDSAVINDAIAAINSGWVKGITTNPTLLAKSELSPEETLKELAKICPGELYYQLMQNDLENMIAEGRKAFEIIGEKTVLKIPATEVGFKAVAKLSPDIACSVTAIYSPAQAVVAKEAGAKYAIAYVNRATRLLGDGLALVEDMSAVLEGSNTKILAASLKSPEEAAYAFMAGATHITVPLSILQQMTTHDLSEQTVVEFSKNGAGIDL
ncbi:MAG: transaldolase family protein [Prochloraceae cyanobacterium]|nr:transaldolase family protein [Prochloraceae cyanobacterium]